MSLFDRVRGAVGGKANLPYSTYDAAQRVLPDPHEPFLGVPGVAVVDPGVPLSWAHKGEIKRIWETQPNVRKVVSFVTRNCATIPFHTFERVSDTDRQRVKDHPLDALMSRPRLRTSPYQFWEAVYSDMLLYDMWAVIFLPFTGDSEDELVQVPSWRLHFQVDAFRRVESVWMWEGQERARIDADQRNKGWTKLDLDRLIFGHGYSPDGAGLSPMVTLKDILDENQEAVAYRRQVWANGARVPTFLSRPVGAPAWSKEARQRFWQGFRAMFTARGPQAGGVPLLEDGMELKTSAAFTPQDSQDLEGRRLTAVEVAAAFHIAPELVGAQQGNYSNVREYRQMLYRDSLGPYYQSIEQILNAQLVPLLAGDREIYIEANIDSKLRGSFEEQAAVISTATGAPWMTRAEARGLRNLPEIGGADQLVVPLNVLVGGQASPRDSGSQNGKSVEASAHDAAGPAAKAQARGKTKSAEVPSGQVTKTRKVLEDFFARQGDSVKSRIGAGDDDWWDGDRWDSELSDDLFKLAALVSTTIGQGTAEEIGFSADDYDVDRTLEYLKAVSLRIAEQTNSTTFDQVTEALAGDDPKESVDNVFEVSEDARADQASASATTTFAGFAAAEAARQNVGERATKTWVVNSQNPRSSHAAMSGETVGIDEFFSNGLEYPGSIGGGADETAGCQCSLQINVPEPSEET